MADEVVEEYKSSLGELTFNSKVHINLLTMLAEENAQYSEHIVKAIEAHLQKVRTDLKLTVLYLIDSIIKNVEVSEADYKLQFAKNLVPNFCAVFQQVDEKIRQKMYKLRTTWNDKVFPKSKLYALDLAIRKIDPAWPLTAPSPNKPVAAPVAEPVTPTSIHVNPRFLVQERRDTETETPDVMRQQLLAKQQELLRLQQQRLELELAEANSRLENEKSELKAKEKAKEVAQTTSGVSGTESVIQATVPASAPRQDPRLHRDPRIAARQQKASLLESVSLGAGDTVTVHQPLMIPPQPAQSSALFTAAGETDASGEKGHAAATPSVPETVPEKPPEQGEAARVELPVATVAPQKVDAELTRLTSVQPNTPASPVSDTSTTKPSSQSSGAAEKSVKSSDAKNGQKGANDQDKDKKGSSSKGSPNSKQSSLEKSKRDAVDHKPDSGGKEEKRGGKRSSDSKGVKRQLDDKTSKGNGGRSSRDKDTGRESPRSKKPRRGDRRSQSPSSRDSGRYESNKSRNDRSRKRNYRSRGSRGDTPDSETEVRHPKRSRSKSPRKSSSRSASLEQDAPRGRRPSHERGLHARHGTDAPHDTYEDGWTYRPQALQRRGLQPPGYGHAPLKSPSSARWSQFKANHADSFPFQQPRQSIELPSLERSVSDDPLSPPPRDRRRPPFRSLSDIGPAAEGHNGPQSQILDRVSEIVAEADQQKSCGNISHEQHQEILKQVSELCRLQEVKQQLRERRVPPFEGGPPPLHEQGAHADSHPEAEVEELPLGQFSPTLPDEDLPQPNGEPSPEEDASAPSTLSPPVKEPLLPTPDIPPSSSANDKPRPTRKRPPPTKERRGPREGPRGSARGPPRAQRVPPRLDDSLPKKLPLPNIRIPKKQNSPVPDARGLVLPYDTDKFYVPVHDSRWYRPNRDTNTFPSELVHEIYIDGLYYEVGLNQAPRSISVDKGIQLTVNVDHETKQVFINDSCYYNIGDPKRSIVIGGRSYKIMYHGPLRRLWIDSVMYDVWSDAPPTRIKIGDKEVGCCIDALTGELHINDEFVCKVGFDSVVAEIFGVKRTITTTRPLKKILVDGQLSEMDFRGAYPCVKIGTVEMGIRFDGPPREIEIDGTAFLVNVHKGRKVKFGNVNHVIAFGGPGHEVIINGKWYECKFNGVPKVIQLGMNRHCIKLSQPHPEVKILGQFVEDKKKIKQLSGGAVIDPALDLEDEVRFVPPPPTEKRTRPRSPLRVPEVPERRPPAPHEGPPDAQQRPSRPPGPAGRFDAPPHERPPGRYDDHRFDDRGAGRAPRPRGYDDPDPRGARPPPPAGREERDPWGWDEPPRRGPRVPPRDECWESQPFEVLPSPSRRLSYSPQMPPPGGLMSPRLIDLPRLLDARDTPPRDPRAGPPPPPRDPRQGRGPREGPLREVGGDPRDAFPSREPLPPRDLREPLPPRDLMDSREPLRPRDPRDRRDPLPLKDPREPLPPDMRDPRAPYPPMPPRDPRDVREPLPRRDPRDVPPYPYERGPYPPPARDPYDVPPGRRPYGYDDRYDDRRWYPEADQYGQWAPPPGPRDAPPYRHPYPTHPDQSYGGPIRAPAPDPPVNINDLLSNLISTGLISTTASTSTAAPAGVQSDAAATAPRPFNALEFISGLQKRPPAAPSEKVEDVPNLTEFNNDLLKKKFRGSFQSLYAGIQCSSCGSRFTPERMDRYREHLDWHFRQNKREKQQIKVAKFRRWYYTTKEWKDYEEFGDLEEQAQSAYFENLRAQDGAQGVSSPSGAGGAKSSTAPAADQPVSCPVASGSENDDGCDICGEMFEQFWDEDAEEWHLKDALRVNNKTYHPTCYEDAKKNHSLEPETPGGDSRTSPELEPTNPLNVLLTSLNPTGAKAEPDTAPPGSGGIPIVSMQQEVKPGVLAAAAAAESEPLPVAAIKEEVEQTPSGSATPTRDEPTETETKPVLKEEATDSRVAPVADTRAADRPTSSAPPAEQQDTTVPVKVESAAGGEDGEARDDAAEDRSATPTQDEPPDTPTQDEPPV